MRIASNVRNESLPDEGRIVLEIAGVSFIGNWLEWLKRLDSVLTQSTL